MNLSEKNQRIAHLTCEILIIVGLIIYFNQKIKKINQNNINTNKEFDNRILTLEYKLEQQNNHIQILKSAIKKQEIMIQEILSFSNKGDNKILVNNDEKTNMMTKKVRFSPEITHDTEEKDSDDDKENLYFEEKIPEEIKNVSDIARTQVEFDDEIQQDHYSNNVSQNLDDLVHKFKKSKDLDTLPVDMDDIGSYDISPSDDEKDMSTSPENDMEGLFSL